MASDLGGQMSVWTIGPAHARSFHKMPIVRISRTDVPGALVDDGTLAALMPRLSQLPRRGNDGSLLIPFTEDTPPDVAVQAIERALDSIPTLAGWRSHLALDV